jgi:dihydrofolate reductase
MVLPKLGPVGTDDVAGFANRMSSLPKYVVSTTLDKLELNNSHIIKDNVGDEIFSLKEQSGLDLLVGGGSKLVQTLIEQNLVDEIRLLIYPVILGEGKRLFKEGTHTKLELLEIRQFNSWVVMLS